MSEKPIASFPRPRTVAEFVKLWPKLPPGEIDYVGDKLVVFPPKPKTKVLIVEGKDRMAVLHKFAKMIPTANRGAKQLTVLAMNRSAKRSEHENIRGAFVRETSAPKWTNHFDSLTKPSGIYSRLAKKFKLTPKQIARICRVEMPAARARQR